MKRNGNALLQVTWSAMRRRWLASLLLAAVAFAGTFAAMVLKNLSWRQENALRNTIANTTISCVVTDARGLDTGNLQMFSFFVERLQGRRHNEDCYLDDYVKNVRAKAEKPLNFPEGTALHRILTLDSDPSLAAASGAVVEFYPGWDEGVFAEREQVCVVSEDMLTADGYLEIDAGNDDKARFRIIGIVKNGAPGAVYCPFYMPFVEGTSVAFTTDSCSFEIRDNERLEESRAAIYEWLVEPAMDKYSDGLTFGVLVQDELYQKSLAEIRSNIAMLRLLLPILIALCGCIGFFSGFLAIRGRNKEFAVMRCIGMSQLKIFALVMVELAALTVAGALAGVAGGIALEGRIEPGALWNAALITGVFLVGSGVAALTITNVNVMKLMKVEE